MKYIRKYVGLQTVSIVWTKILSKNTVICMMFHRKKKKEKKVIPV